MTGRRRALAQYGGRISQHGDPAWSEPLAAGLAASDGGATDDLTHGFHAYPARMHPVLARELLARFSEPGQVVLDPFAGSGTVLVEAMVAGCKAQGVDLSPLASRIAEQQCALRDAKSRAKFVATLTRVAEASEARVRGRVAVDVPISRDERTFYDPHVMLELSGLWAEIQQLRAEEDKRALELVFSTLLVKFSRQRADTTEERTPKRIRKGLPTEFFARKGHELTLRWEALWDSVPNESFATKFEEGDARHLPELLGARFRADLILTSPPYGGTYNYADHHARRTAWLKLDVRALRAGEIGARRNLSDERESGTGVTPRDAETPADARDSRGGRDGKRDKAASGSGGRRSAQDSRDARSSAGGERGRARDARQVREPRDRSPVARWNRELGQALESMRAVMRKDSAIVMWLGDAELAGTRVAADQQIAGLAPSVDLELVASAAQEREDMRGGPPRREHLLLLHPR